MQIAYGKTGQYTKTRQYTKKNYSFWDEWGGVLFMKLTYHKYSEYMS